MRHHRRHALGGIGDRNDIGCGMCCAFSGQEAHGAAIVCSSIGLQISYLHLGYIQHQGDNQWKKMYGESVGGSHDGSAKKEV